MYKKYYSYNDMPVPVQKEKTRAEESAQLKCAEQTSPPCVADKEKKDSNRLGGLFAGFEADDIILIAVILVLLLEDCQDKLLIAVIAFILVSGWNENK